MQYVGIDTPLGDDYQIVNCILCILDCICKEAPLEFGKKATLDQHFLLCSSCDSEEVIV